MTNSTDRQMVEYLVHCSLRSLRAFQLRHLNQAANLRRELLELIDRLAESLSDARLAQLLREHGAAIISGEVPAADADSGRKAPERGEGRAGGAKRSIQRAQQNMTRAGTSLAPAAFGPLRLSLDPGELFLQTSLARLARRGRARRCA